jgi:hypothetical protein
VELACLQGGTIHLQMTGQGKPFSDRQWPMLPISRLHGLRCLSLFDSYADRFPRAREKANRKLATMIVLIFRSTSIERRELPSLWASCRGAEDRAKKAL